MSDRIRPSDLPYAGDRPSGVGLCKNSNGDLLWDSGSSISQASGGAGGAGGVSLSSRPTVALLGDSITFRCHTNGKARFETSDTTGTVSELADGWFNWLNWQAGNPFRIVFNGAVSGERTGQILARFDAFAAAIGDVNYVVLMAGTNDVADNTYTAEMTIDNLRSMLRRDYQYILAAIPPRTALTAEQKQKYNRIRDWILNYAAIEFPGTIIIDNFIGAVNATTVDQAWINTISASSDGIHPEKLGVNQMITQASIDLITSKFRPYSLVAAAPDSFDGGGSPASTPYGDGFNILTAAQSLMLSGGGGTTTGAGTITGAANIPSGWSLDASAGTTIAVSLAARADGCGNDLVLDVTTTGVNGNGALTCASALTSKTSDGKWYEGACQIAITDASRVLRHAYTSVYHTTVLVSRSGESSYDTIRGISTPKQPFTHVIPRWQKLAGYGCFMRPIFFTAPTAGTFQIKVGRVSLREYSSRD